jgi:hypothetical protein
MKTKNKNPGSQKASRPLIPKDYGVPQGEETMLPWAMVEEQLHQERIYWVCTVRPDGRPHSVPLWGAWFNERFYFDGSSQTRHVRNLMENPAVSVHLESGEEVVIIDGIGRAVGKPDRDLAMGVYKIYKSKYAGYPGYDPTPEMWDEGGLYEVVPQRVLAWRNFPNDATRWVFVNE